jgi:hypothetical protein
MSFDSPKVESNNAIFAEDLAQRLNRLVRDADVDTYAAIQALIETRIQVSDTVADHPDIIVTTDGKLGFLGLVNAALRQGCKDEDQGEVRIAIQVREEDFRFVTIAEASYEDDGDA